MKLTPVESAANFQAQGFNCSQSVFTPFATQFGLNEKTALQLASPFGGGFSNCGEVCGAVTGGLLALGLARGADTPPRKPDIYRLSQVFMRMFKEKHGTLLCRDLIDCDLSTPEGVQKAKEAGKFKNICLFLVRDSAEILQTLLETA